MKLSLLKKVLLALLLALLLASVAVGLIAIGEIYNLVLDAERTIVLKIDDLDKSGSKVYDRNGNIIVEFDSIKKNWCSFDQFPDHLIWAFVYAEDADFFKHSGVSLSGIIRASLKNITAGRIVQGGSTITQQLARNVFLTNKKSFERKIKEILLAFLLEKKLSKKKILEQYLNRIFLGNHSYGVKQASWNYFRKDVIELNIAESAILAALPKAPSKLAPNRFPKAVKLRQGYILQRMKEEGYLSEEERVDISQKSVQVYSHSRRQPQSAEYFLLALKKWSLKRLGLSKFDFMGIEIHTTLDLALQNHVKKVLGESTGLFKKSGRYRNSKLDLEMASIVIDPENGGVLALQGGKDFQKSQYNRVLNTYRPLGGMLTPLLVALAVESGYALNSPVIRQPSKGRSKKDAHKGSDRGLITLYELMKSEQVKFSGSISRKLGMGTIKGFLDLLGLKSDSTMLSLALGSDKVTLFQLARAYLALADRGVINEPYLIEKIVTSSGDIIYQRERGKTGKRVLSEQAAFIVENVMNNRLIASDLDGYLGAKQPFSNWVGFDSRLSNGWFIGFNNQLLSAFWVGSESGKSKVSFSKGGMYQGLRQLWSYYNSNEDILKKYKNSSDHIPNNIIFSPFVKRNGESVVIPMRSRDLSRF